MADIAELTRLLAYYRNGGGKRKNQVGNFLSSLGTAASGIGTGFKSAAEPAIAEQKIEREALSERRKNASTLLGKAIDEGAGFTGEQATDILDRGQFPASYTFGGKKVKNKAIYDVQTGTWIYPPEGYEAAGHTPYPPKDPASKESEAALKRKADKNRVIGAARSGKLTIFNEEDGKKEYIDVNTPEEFDEIVTMLGQDPDDPDIVSARQKIVSKPRKPGLMERAANATGRAFGSAGSAAKSAVKGLMSPAKTITVQTSDGQTVEISEANLATARARDPKLKVLKSAK